MPLDLIAQWGALQELEIHHEVVESGGENGSHIGVVPYGRAPIATPILVHEVVAPNEQ